MATSPYMPRPGMPYTPPPPPPPGGPTPPYPLTSPFPVPYGSPPGASPPPPGAPTPPYPATSAVPYGSPPGPPGAGNQLRPIGFEPFYSDTSVFQKRKDKKRKQTKRNRGKYSSSSSDEDDKGSTCPSCPPATQIFLCPPGNTPPPQNGNYGDSPSPVCPKCDCLKRPDAAQTPRGAMDPYNMCAQQCWGGQGGRLNDGPTQMMCPLTQLCQGCHKKSKKKTPTQTMKNCYCCRCGSESKKKRKPQESTTEGMMPATQQFLMFLQAYGLASALIKDRCRREEEYGMDQGGRDPKTGPPPKTPPPRRTVRHPSERTGKTPQN